jgi:predicted nucleotidyltransferase component of viral defense system
VAAEKTRNIVASVRDRLVMHSKAIGADPNLVLIWYGLERLLYRMSVSRYRDRFVLKGAMLFRLWSGPEFRPTKDLDLLGVIHHETEALRDAFTSICIQAVEDDGLVFDPKSMRIVEIREAQEYGGLRVSVMAKLGVALVPLQIDVGFGDAITPAATMEEFPSILNQPRPNIRAYPRETVVAEKYEAMVQRGMANSRMKDYFDLWFLSQRFEFDGQRIADAMTATFGRRRTALPDGVPIGLTPEFASDTAHERQWSAFLRRVSIAAPRDLGSVIQLVSDFVLPPSNAAATVERFARTWQQGEWRH